VFSFESNCQRLNQIWFYNSTGRNTFPKNSMYQKNEFELYNNMGRSTFPKNGLYVQKEWFCVTKRMIYTATHHSQSEVLQKRFDTRPKTLQSLQQNIEKNFHAKTIFTPKICTQCTINEYLIARVYFGWLRTQPMYHTGLTQIFQNDLQGFCPNETTFNKFECKGSRRQPYASARL
jgi:hypothetical protein